MPTTKIIRPIWQAAAMYRSGLSSPADVWNVTVACLTPESAFKILNGLPQDVQSTLRESFTPNGVLRSDQTLYREVERWRTTAPVISSRS